MEPFEIRINIDGLAEQLKVTPAKLVEEEPEYLTTITWDRYGRNAWKQVC